jgi:exonuclease V gamma subunit
MSKGLLHALDSRVSLTRAFLLKESMLSRVKVGIRQRVITQCYVALLKASLDLLILMKQIILRSMQDTRRGKPALLGSVSLASILPVCCLIDWHVLTILDINSPQLTI